MHTRADFLNLLRRERVVGWLHAGSPEDALRAARTAAQAGLHFLEVSLTSPEALRVITQIRADGHLLVGAGGVRDEAQAKRALKAGAMYLSCAHYDRRVLLYARRRRVPAVFGAATPTEVVQAHRDGADLVKIYPAGHLGGPNYLDSLRRLYPDIPLAAAGAISPEDAPAYLAAGAIAVYLGGGLFTPDLLAETDQEALSTRFKTLFPALK